MGDSTLWSHVTSMHMKEWWHFQGQIKFGWPEQQGPCKRDMMQKLLKVTGKKLQTAYLRALYDVQALMDIA